MYLLNRKAIAIMRTYINNLFGIVLLLTLFSCGNKNTADNNTNASLTTNPPDSIAELPFPIIPDSITEAVDRADYVILHFWDLMDFNDRNLTTDESFMEQNFVNYYSIFSLASEKARHQSVRDLILKFAVDSIGFHQFLKVSDRYLFDPDSPVRNDLDFIIFLTEEINSGLLPDHDIEWRRGLFQLASKNNPGNKAENFNFRLKDGLNTSLYGLKFKGDLIIFFYDPDCNNCQRVKEQLKLAKNLNNLIDKEEITLLALAVTDDLDKWQEAVATMPGSWMHAIDFRQTDENLTYDLRALPSIYMLDSTLNVIYKDLDSSAIN